MQGSQKDPDQSSVLVQGSLSVLMCSLVAAYLQSSKKELQELETKNTKEPKHEQLLLVHRGLDQITNLLYRTDPKS